MSNNHNTPTVATQHHEQEVGNLNDKLKKLRERTERAEATAAGRRIWKAAHVGTKPADAAAVDDDALLRDLVLAIVDGHEAGWPTARAQAVEDQDIHRPKPGSQPPVGGNPGARRALTHLRHRVRAEIQIFKSKQRQDFGVPDDDDLDAADISHAYRIAHKTQGVEVYAQCHSRTHHDREGTLLPRGHRTTECIERATDMSPTSPSPLTKQGRS